MSIIIQNIDKNLREKGEHLYQLRINSKVICEFTHYREHNLATLLMKASFAVLLDKAVENYLKEKGYDK